METNAQISPSVPAMVMLYISCYFILITNNLIKTITLYFHTVLLSLFFSCLFVLFFDFLEKNKQKKQQKNTVVTWITVYTASTMHEYVWIT